MYESQQRAGLNLTRVCGHLNRTANVGTTLTASIRVFAEGLSYPGVHVIVGHIGCQLEIAQLARNWTLRLVHCPLRSRPPVMIQGDTYALAGLKSASKAWHELRYQN
jgi:hypothetical protein